MCAMKRGFQLDRKLSVVKDLLDESSVRVLTQSFQIICKANKPAINKTKTWHKIIQTFIADFFIKWFDSIMLSISRRKMW